MSQQHPPAPTASAVGPCSSIFQISRTPRYWKFTKHHRIPFPLPPPLYREANKRIQMAVENAKKDWIDAQCEEIETCLNENKSKRAYQLVKDLTSEKQGRSSTIQDRSGKCLTEKQETLSRGQNSAKNCTTKRVVVKTQYWIAVSTRKKICNRSSKSKLRSQ